MLRQRSLQETISTTACNTVRRSGFQARLDLYYFYLIEYTNTTVLDLPMIDKAIALSIVQVLKECDVADRPKYAVVVSPNGHQLSQGGAYDTAGMKCVLVRSAHHIFLGGGVCAAVSDGAQCSVVRGATSVLLDGDVSDAEYMAYKVIERVLTDTDYLRYYTGMSLIRSEFVRPIGENLAILNPTTPASSAASGGTLKIAIAAAFVSMAVTTIFFYGLYRRRKMDKKTGTNVKSRLAHYNAKRRRYFQELEDRDASAGWMTTDPSQLPEPSITWSVSDLTSDSQSIRSSLPMERIKEEGPSDDEFDEEVSTNPSNSPASSGRPNVYQDHVHLIAHWKDTVDELAYNGDCSSEDDHTPVRHNGLEEYDATCPDLHGTRFLEDSYEDSYQDIDNSNVTDPTEESPLVHHLMDGSPSSPDGLDSTTYSDSKESDEPCSPSDIHMALALESSDDEEERVIVQVAPDIEMDSETMIAHVAEPFALAQADQVLQAWIKNVLFQLEQARSVKRIGM